MKDKQKLHIAELRRTHPSKLREKRRKGFIEVFETFDALSNKTLEQLNDYNENETLKKNLTLKEASILKFFTELIKKGDAARLELFMNVYGIPTKIRPLDVKQADDLYNSPDQKVVDVTPVPMTMDEKLNMLDKYRDIIKSKKNES